ncbi:probable cell wall integrity protein scw1 at C-terminar half [Coccomyxa sp. Obi]|nr:probable cell wall integrity protein scw1 at C-terminar half [Coccomyxa sp. Obi]
MASYQSYDPAAAQPQYVAAPAQAYAPAPAGYAPQQAAYAPAPAYTAYAPAYSNPDEVRTIFVTGFPADVKERELNNMLRFVHGYEASQMHWKNGLAQGFALFTHGEAARMAINSIHNLVFDDGAVLRCEMARKNMYIKDDAAAAAKRGRMEYSPYPSAPSPTPSAGAYYAPATAPAPVQPRSYVPVNNTKDNPPCNTLFIGNLSESTNEDELRGLFVGQPGFRQLKLVRGARSVTCFVEFSDVASAMSVHQSQQGAVLTTSDRGGIRIQYSKNPFGKKRDANGNWINTHDSPAPYAPYSPSPSGAGAGMPPAVAQPYGGAGYGGADPAAAAPNPASFAPAPAQPTSFEAPPQQQSYNGLPPAEGAPGTNANGFEQDMSGGALQPVKEEHEGAAAAEEELKREEAQPM